MEKSFLSVQSFCDSTSLCGMVSVSNEYIKSFVEKTGKKNKVKIVFTIDTSGSMNDMLSSDSSKSKMSVVSESLAEIFNTLCVLGDHGHDIHVVILKFDTSVYKLYDGNVSGNKITELSNVIGDLTPILGTDLGVALKETNLVLNNLYEEGATMISIFATDGKNSKEDENKNIITEFTSSKFRASYLGIGIGSAGDYDEFMMNSLFSENFSPCPTSSDISREIIGYTFAESSNLLTNIEVKFEGDDENYDIYIPLVKKTNDMHDHTYIGTSINISTKIPFYLNFKKEKYIVNPIKINISGLDVDGLITSFEYLFSTIVSEQNECDIYKSYFDFQKKYNSIDKTNKDAYALELKKLLFDLKKYIETISVNHSLYDMYNTFLEKLQSINNDIGTIHVANLNEKQFQNYLNFGNMRLNSLSSCKRETSSSARKISRQISDTYSVDQRVNIANNILPSNQISRLTMAKLRRQINRPENLILQTFEQDEKEIKELKCVICCEDQVDVLCMPCKHISCCKKCTKTGGIDKCPICNISIDYMAEVQPGYSELCNEINCKKMANIVYYPCKHISVCEYCSSYKYECDICNMSIQKCIKIFPNGF